MVDADLPDPPNEPPHADENGQRGRRAHETTDVDVRQIGLFGAGLVLLAIVVHYALGAMMQAYSTQQFELVGKGTPTAPILWSSSVPRLQVDPADELHRLRAQEDARLGSYGWVDRREGVVHIPIARALELMAERGLPTREAKGERAGSQETKRESDSVNKVRGEK